MRKRKTPELDPLDPTQYHPNVQHLRDCAWMAVGMDFPSLSFMATLAWARSQVELMDKRTASGEHLFQTVVAPHSLPADILTYLAWSLCPNQYLQFPSGAKVMIMLSGSNGGSADKINWEISFPEGMGGKYETIQIKYDILRSGLHETSYEKRARPHKLFFSERMCHIDGSAEPALAKRGRWYAPNPHQITEASGPPIAKQLLRSLWERKNTGPGWRSLHTICFYYVRCKTKNSGIRPHARQLFGVLLWLFLKGYIKMIRGTNFANYGPDFSYRLTRRKNIITDYRDLPRGMWKTIERCVCCENLAIVFCGQLTDYWDRTLPKQPQSHVIHRSDIHNITKQMHDPLVIDVLLDIIAADRTDENPIIYYSPKREKFLYRHHHNKSN